MTKLDPHAESKPGAQLQTAEGPLRLTPREWLVTLCVVCACGWVIPRVWTVVEPFEPEPQYRIPFDLSADHWLFERWTQVAVDEAEVLVVGDSVVWGEYVAPGQSLAGALAGTLSRATGRRFANLGVSGIHPLALEGLLRDYAELRPGSKVLLHSNPLWMSSPQRDLRVVGNTPFNHPELVPQILGRPPALTSSFSERFGTALGRGVELWSWARHIRLAHYGGQDLYRWTLRNPRADPLTRLAEELPAPAAKLRHRPVSWTERGIEPQELAWVEPATSLQWAAFLRTVERLREEGASLLVVYGPFNDHLLTPTSRDRYRSLSRELITQLTKRGVDVFAPASLPSELYADASHPLAAGYERLAAELESQPRFRAWLEE